MQQYRRKFRVVLFLFKSLSLPAKQRELLGCAHNTVLEDALLLVLHHEDLHVLLIGPTY